jgi:hypothetical protein
MNLIDDERLLFFLEHATQIREWAALEDEVRALTNAYLDQMLTTWTEQGGLPADAIPSLASARWKRLALHHPAWADDAGNARVHVAIEWHPQEVGLDQQTSPYVGVRTDLDLADGSVLSKQLRAALQAHREMNAATSSRWWPCYRRIVPKHTDGPLDLHQYGQMLVGALAAEWQAARDLVTAVLTQTEGLGP